MPDSLLELAAQVPSQEQQDSPLLAVAADPQGGEALKKYEGYHELRGWQSQVKDAQESTGSWLARNVNPFLRIKNSVLEGRARERIARGTHEPGDAELVATQERLHQLDEGAGTDERIGAGLLHIPSLIVEGFTGARAVRALGAGIGGLTGAGAAAGEVAGSGALARLGTTLIGEAGGGGLAARIGGLSLRQTLATPFMPSIYGERAVHNNLEAGRDALDLRGLPNALALGAVQNTIFGSLGQYAQGVGRGVPGFLARQTMRAGAGIGEQAIADLVTSTIGLDTGYGLIGDLLRGKGDKALQDVIVQAVTFAAFGGLHDAQHGNEPRQSLLPQIAETLKEAAKQGLPVKEAIKEVAPIVESMKPPPESPPNAPGTPPVPGGLPPTPSPPVAAPPKPVAPPPPPMTTREQLNKLEADHLKGVSRLNDATIAVRRAQEAVQGAGLGPDAGRRRSQAERALAMAEKELKNARGSVKAMERARERLVPEVWKEEAAEAAKLAEHPATPPEAAAELKSLPKEIENEDRKLSQQLSPEHAASVRHQIDAALSEEAKALEADAARQGVHQEPSPGPSEGAAPAPGARPIGGESGTPAATGSGAPGGDIVDPKTADFFRVRPEQQTLIGLAEQRMEKEGKPGFVGGGYSAQGPAKLYEPNAARSVEPRTPDRGPEPTIDPKASDKQQQAQRMAYTKWKNQSELRALEQEAISKGIDLDSVHRYADGMMKEENEANREHNEIIRRVRQYYPEYNFTKAKQGERGIDEASLPGFDSLAKELAAEYKGIFGDQDPNRNSGKNSEILFKILVDGQRPETTKAEALRQSIDDHAEAYDDLERFVNREVDDVLQEAKEAQARGIDTPAPEKLIRQADQKARERVYGDEEKGNQAGSDAESEATGRAEGQLSDNDPGNFTGDPGDFTAMGAAGRGRGPGRPAGGAPGAGTPNVPGGSGPTVKPTTSWFQKAADWLKSFANQTFPSLTRLARPSGEKLAQVANAGQAAKSSWEYLSNVIKHDGVRLADMDVETRRQIGATWLEMRARHLRDVLTKQGLNANDVITLVGQPDSPLTSEAEYQQNVKDLWGFFEAIKQEWTPEVDKNFRGLMGIDPFDAINAPSQIPQLPLNLIPLKEGDTGPGIVSTGRRADLGNVRIRKPSTAYTAGLDSPAYDIDLHHMMQRSLDLGVPAARRAEFVRQGIEDGVIHDATKGSKPPEGWDYLALKVAGGLPGLDPKAEYYSNPDVTSEILRGLGIGKRPGENFSGLKPITDKLNAVSLMSPVELATHIGNHVTAQFLPGMKGPVKGIIEAAGNMWKIYNKDPEMLRRVMELAKISASFGHEVRPGLLGEKLKAYDPTWYINKYTSALIDTMQKAVRVQLDDAYFKVARNLGLEQTETARRDFINQAVGNYNSQASNHLTQFLKDTGLQPFATAATTFTVQGVKSLVGKTNIKAETWAKDMQLRAMTITKLLPIVALGPVINSLMWGQPFPTNIPAFAIKTRDDDENGKVKYFDPLSFTGLRRGARATGVNALVESAAGAESRVNLGDRMLRDAKNSLFHLFEGPPVQAGHTLLTGENAMGHRVAPLVSTATTPRGIYQAARRGQPPPGSNQYLENAKAALGNVNPLIGTFSEADRPATSRMFLENVFRSAGPFGERERSMPMSAAERRRRGLR